MTALADAVARSLFKLMAYKDEYEVARLYTNGHFEKQVASAFEGDNLVYEFHMAPPILAKKDPVTGLPRKMSFGPWMLKAMGVLAKFRRLPRHAARRLRLQPRAPHRAPARSRVRGRDRRDRGEARRRQSCDAAIGLAGIPQKIRGYGHVKERNLKAAKAEEADLLAKFRNGPQPLPIAAE